MSEGPPFNCDLSFRASAAAGVLPNTFSQGMRELARAWRTDEESWQLNWQLGANNSEFATRAGNAKLVAELPNPASSR